MRSVYVRLLLAVALVFGSAIAARQQPAPSELTAFSRQEVLVPMRDGVRLQTAVFVPKGAGKPLPFLLRRTPYGIPEDEGWAKSGPYDELIADGYIFVFQNLRGRFKSEGQWVMQRPPRDRAAPQAIDESTDAWDTIDWLLKNVPNNNGRAGIFGVSYLGWTTTMALLDPHPALKAASEQASPADMFLGDDFHHNGAFRLSYGFEYAWELESEKEKNANFPFDRYDTYEWYLALGALSNANARYFHGRIPTWNDFVNHPNRDSFWKRQAFDAHLRATSVPNLNVGGWWDQEDFYGPFKIYELLEATDTRGLNYIVAGPWNHGGWSRGTGERLGPIEFGSPTGTHFRAKIQAPWFAYWLHDKGPLKQPEALMFQTGSNEWRSYEAWPPKKGITPRKLYFHAGGRLSFAPPGGGAGAGFDSYVSDPANPVPYRPRPITPTYPGPDWPVWLLQDQRFVDHRPDVLSWQTEPLREDLTVTGEILADLFASTSGGDADWIVKLIDVYPDNLMSEERSLQEKKRNLSGYQLMIANEVFRGRFRNSFEKPEPIPAGKVLEYKFSLHSNDHVFKKGHKAMVQVQSTWFPVIDRNPQSWVPNIFQAKDSDYRKATQRIFRSKAAPSGVLLPVSSQ
jgi:putative CocE/NonD family hydrolase